MKLTNCVDASKDGITHINVYSKAQTELGQLLSNFAHTPFVITINNVKHRFASAEGFWYWKKTGDAKFKTLFGSQAKQDGKNAILPYPDPTKEELTIVYHAKLNAHPKIKQMLIESTLPFAHYYVFGGKKVNADDYLWTVELWDDIRTQLHSIEI